MTDKIKSERERLTTQLSQHFVESIRANATADTPSADLSFKNDDGSTTTIEVKRSEPRLFDFISGSIYSLTGKSIRKSRRGTLAFNARLSEFVFLDHDTDTATTYKARKNNIQWLMSKELFEAAPEPCSLAELSNAYEAAYYFNRNKPDEEKEYKLFLNTRKRINTALLINLRIVDVVEYSGGDYMINESFIAK